MLVTVGVALIVQARGHRLAAIMDPRLVILGLTMAAQAVYLSLDYLSYDDLYQMLPYAALGFGAMSALALRRARANPRSLTTLRAGTVVGLVVLVTLSCLWFLRDPFNNHELPAQRADGCALDRIVPEGTRLYALGDPVPLVLTHRSNPDRYIYLDSGVTQWKIDHTVGGFRAWIGQVTGPDVSAIVLQGWNGRRAAPMERAILRAGYREGWLGEWHTFLDSAASARARTEHIRVTALPTTWPQTTSGAWYRVQTCSGGPPERSPRRSNTG
jgi:hypothetical protein